MSERHRNKDKNVSRKQLVGAIATSLILSFFLIVLFIFMLLPGHGAAEAPAGPSVMSTARTVSYLADRFFLFVVPLTILFFLYAAFLLTGLVKSLSNTTVCTYDNHECEYQRKYFHCKNKLEKCDSDRK